MSTRFPSQGMKALMKKHPEKSKFIQCRLFTRHSNGSIAGVIEIEGPITAEESKAITTAAMGRLDNKECKEKR